MPAVDKPAAVPESTEPSGSVAGWTLYHAVKDVLDSCRGRTPFGLEVLEAAVSAWEAENPPFAKPAASPVAGVSADELRGIAHTLWYRGGRLRSELQDALVTHPENWHTEGLQRMLAQWDEIANQYASNMLLAQPSAEGDEWIAARALRTAVLLVLDSADYTAGNCRANEMVGAVLPREIIVQLRNAVYPLPAPPVAKEGRES
jgi:hypothetical protein